MLEDVYELMPAKPWSNHAESTILPLEETDIAAVHCVLDAQNFSLLLSGDGELEHCDLYRAGILVEEHTTIPPKQMLSKSSVSQNVRDQQR